MEAITRPAIPDVPDERAMVEEFAVLLEEVMTQPIVQGRAWRCDCVSVISLCSKTGGP